MRKEEKKTEHVVSNNVANKQTGMLSGRKMKPANKKKRTSKRAWDREKEREIESLCEKTGVRERGRKWALAFDWSSIGNRNALFVTLLICKDQSLFVSWFFAWTATHTHTRHVSWNARSALIYSNHKLCSVCDVWVAFTEHRHKMQSQLPFYVPLF